MDWLNNHAWTDDKESVESLHKAGLSSQEIVRLGQFRRAYQCRPDEQDRLPPSFDLAHLQFIRWLVISGKLADQMLEEHCFSEGTESQSGFTSRLPLTEPSPPSTPPVAHGVPWFRQKLREIGAFCSRFVA